MVQVLAKEMSTNHFSGSGLRSKWVAKYSYLQIGDGIGLDNYIPHLWVAVLSDLSRVITQQVELGGNCGSCW